MEKLGVARIIVSLCIFSLPRPCGDLRWSITGLFRHAWLLYAFDSLGAWQKTDGTFNLRHK